MQFTPRRFNTRRRAVHACDGKSVADIIAPPPVSSLDWVMYTESSHIQGVICMQVHVMGIITCTCRR